MDKKLAMGSNGTECIVRTSLCRTLPSVRFQIIQGKKIQKQKSLLAVCLLLSLISRPVSLATGPSPLVTWMLTTCVYFSPAFLPQILLMPTLCVYISGAS